MNYNFNTIKELQYIKNEITAFKNDRGFEKAVVNTGYNSNSTSLVVLLLCIFLFGAKNVVPVGTVYFLEDEKNVLSKQISVILDKFNIKNNIVNIHDPVANILDMIDINKITITPGQIYFLRNDLTGAVMRTVARSINGFVVGGLSLTDLVLYRSPVMGDFLPFKNLTASEARQISVYLIQELGLEKEMNSIFTPDNYSFDDESFSDEDLDKFIRTGTECFTGLSPFGKRIREMYNYNIGVNGQFYYGPSATAEKLPNYLLTY